jgi:hypothetical protein
MVKDAEQLQALMALVLGKDVEWESPYQTPGAHGTVTLVGTQAITDVGTLRWEVTAVGSPKTLHIYCSAPMRQAQSPLCHVAVPLSGSSVQEAAAPLFAVIHTALVAALTEQVAALEALHSAVLALPSP